MEIRQDEHVMSGCRRWGILVLGLGLIHYGAFQAAALIERLTPLQSIIQDSDFIFVANVERVDPERPAAVLTFDRHLKGEFSSKRLPVNLTGDKEKHTPELLKRIAPKLPLVVFVTDLDDKLLVLAYSNGTWLQIIGTRDGADVRWAFTHCEIYLRRTFIGTTAELIDVVQDAVAGKKKPPKPNAKEKPGFGPELEAKPAKSARYVPCPPARCRTGGEPAWGVITLPFLAPLAALLQLLFPGLLRDQWKQYRLAISILMTQSTLLGLHWIVLRWFVTKRPWWAGDEYLWGALVAVSLIGAIVAVVLRAIEQSRGTVVSLPPRNVEYIALGGLLAAGLAWGAFLSWTGTSPYDQMAVVTGGATLALLHLLYRRRRFAAAAPPRLWFSTEMVFLWGLVFTGTALGMYLNVRGTNRVADTLTADWPIFRGNPQRTGSRAANDRGPRQPELLWTFDPSERKGRVRIHSSPTVVEGQVFVGALHEIQTLSQGYVYCINAVEGRKLGETTLAAGEKIWRFNAQGSLKPVYSSPTLADGRLYVGEGYHEDQACRLFCLDPQQGDAVIWSLSTRNHVESSPCVAGARVYLGAGDDGLLCVEAPATAPGVTPVPHIVWQIPEVHVDASPVVADNRVFVGSILGDTYHEFCALAVDAETGEVKWRVASPLPLPASPAYSAGRVLFGLGAGKVDSGGDDPTGAIWCLDAETGNQKWEFKTADAVLSAPAIADNAVVCTARDQHCYCIDFESGTLRWKVDLGSPLIASPIVASGKVYVVATTGVVSCLALDDGHELWRFAELDVPDDDAYASPTLAEGRLYVAAGGKVYCIGDRRVP